MQNYHCDVKFRERFLKTMRFEPVDHPPLVVPAGWDLTFDRWRQEGLPEGVGLYEYFELEPFDINPIDIDTLVYPPVEEKILEQTDKFDVMIDKRGVKVRSFKDRSSMPEFIEYPIKGPESLDWLYEKMDPNTPGRIGDKWLQKALEIRRKGGLLFCNGGMYFAFLNERMGTEKVLYAYHDCPEFVHTVNDLVCGLCEAALNKCLSDIPLDYIAYHEDMAYKNGSIISPNMFREFMIPYYKRIMAIAQRHGIDLHWMDCDGDIRELIPLWLECGINIFYPLEVAAGMDVVELRNEYGKSVAMFGGFDKRILASDKKAIKTEIKRIAPVIEGGGYIPSCDHGVPPDVSFENLCCFVETLKSLYGI